MDFKYLWLIPLCPLIGVFINAFIGHLLPRKVSGAIASLAVLGSLIVSVMGLLHLLGLPEDQRVLHQSLFDWIATGAVHTQVAFVLDPLSAVMVCVVSGIGFLIHVYSMGYMAHDPRYPRFFAYMNLFTFAMLLLVLADNFLLMYVGWEGVALCSYLLIGFWFERPSAAAAGQKAFIVNRVGDWCFILGMLFIFVTFGSLTFQDVFAKVAAAPLAVPTVTMTIICLLLFAGATGKSAQIPLYVWLPDAMEGPTPVSALIHAATMVTAGVYMVARCHILFVHAPVALMVVAGIGAATALFAALIGLVQNDIKRVLAYSTVSQLGYMFMACGVGAFAAGIFHVMTHAFFKALLFLGSGSVIHAMHDEQDIRRMGGLSRWMPVTTWTFWIATLAIAGIPLFSGFISKDQILWYAFSSPLGGVVLWTVGVVTALLTAFYMARVTYKTFHGQPRMDEETQRHIHESPASMSIVLILLAVGAVFAGFLNMPEALMKIAPIGWLTHLFGASAETFSDFLAPSVGTQADVARALEMLHRQIVPTSHVWEMRLMGVTVVLSVLGIYAGYQMYVRKPGSAWSIARSAPWLYNLLLNKFYVDEFYKAVVVRPGMGLAYFLWRGIDVLVIDAIVNAVATIVGIFSHLFRGLQTGYVRNYAAGMVLGAIVVIWVLTR
ncbi:MAG: NADH-quinone oxidoreductase subunit L [Armatimonadetes bacterium]|nr:NADH-quinone oxidoreductase subunit L [Armatimonadota bacterium]